MLTELLAPAKNIQIAKTAIDCGADAVYIGSAGFGARQKAGNPLEDIAELVKYAHKFYAKVFVTVNIIITDSELSEVKELITNLYDIGVDAIIVQDMAIVKMAIEKEIPPIPIHISTQCDNRLEDKVSFFARMGLPRVVLARELSINEIKNIIDKNPDIEIETFIHGALCVSYSGQCYLSQFIGGRSANRGECAQPCRKKYSLIDDKGNILVKDKHLLSLKDFNASKHIKSLVDIGVKSYKIEGRLKDELYVKNVVSYYRQELDKYSKKSSSGRVIFGFEPDLDKSFNRGYTDYFLDCRKDCFNFNSPKFIGERIGKVVKVTDKYFSAKLDKNIKLNNQDGLCFDETGERGCLINRVEGECIYPNKMPDIKSGDIIYRNADTVFERSVLNAKTKRQIGVSFIFENNILTAIDEDNNQVSITLSEREPAENYDKMYENFKKSLSKTGGSDFYVNRTEIKTKLPFVPLSGINEYRRCILDKLVDERLSNYKREFQQPLKYVNYYRSEIDYRGNVHNLESEMFYQKCGVNVNERSFESGEPDCQVELMRTKHCIKYAMGMCKSDKRLFLVDEKGKKYPLKFDCKNCEMAVMS